MKFKYLVFGFVLPTILTTIGAWNWIAYLDLAGLLTYVLAVVFSYLSWKGAKKWEHQTK